MGRLYSYTYVSLDGVMSSPESWTSPFWSDEMGEDLTRRLEKAAAMVLGRATYQEFAGFWPRQGSDVPFADLNNRVRKLVVSRSVTEPDWHNSSAVGLEGLGRWKAEGDLHITGSRGLIRSLLVQGLLDEMVLMMCPIVLGDGKRLFEDSCRIEMRVTDLVPFPNGVVCVTLRPRSGS
jgi:dihydrofolate reductase